MAKSPYADLPEVLKKNLPAMFKSYPNLNTDNPSSWFVWADDKVKSYNATICHARMCYDGTGWMNMITAVPKNDQLSLEYLRMLIRGPFRSLSDLIKLDRVGKNYYLHLLSLNKWPANVLMNFCIASRVPIEFDYLLPVWAKRCEVGFDPTLAFLLTYSYDGCMYYTNQQHTYRSFNMARSGHMWLDPKSNWLNILDGTFENVSKPFNTHPGDSRPTNIIWGYCNDHKKLVDMTDEQIAEFYQQPIKIFEPPPPPAPKPKKMGHGYVYGQGLVMPALPADLNIAVQNILYDPNIQGAWGLAQPDMPQPQHAEPFHDPDDDFDDDLEYEPLNAD